MERMLHCNDSKEEMGKTIYVCQLLPYLTAKVLHSYVFKLEDILQSLICSHITENKPVFLT